jgi:hypothetical protein
MKPSKPIDIAEVFRNGSLIDEALDAAARDAVQLHKEKGLPLVVWRDGKIVWITPEEAENDMGRAGVRNGGGG